MSHSPRLKINKRKNRNAAGKTASYPALALAPSAISSQSVPEEVRAKLRSEPLVKYSPPICDLKRSVQVAQETER
jgi:hypothetical protein